MSTAFLRVSTLALLLPAFAQAQYVTAYSHFQPITYTGETANVVATQIQIAEMNRGDANHKATMNHDDASHQAKMNHGDASQPPAMNHQAASKHTAPQQGGQSAFAAIQEIVDILGNDPETDWTHVDIEALRLHLIDMDQVTLRANVKAEALPNGARFTATSPEPAVATSIKNMVLAHAATMDGVEGWHLNAQESNSGAVLTVEGAESDAVKIRALGFIGIMTVGMHHQLHHLALASGSNPHDH